jgi:hypothetical protein
MHAHQIAMASVLGAAPTGAARSATARVLYAFTPALRAFVLFHNRLDRRRAVVGVERIPHLLAVTAAFAGLAADAGVKNLSYLTLTQLFRKHADLIELLANVDRPMWWRGAATVEMLAAADHDDRVRFARLARAVLQQRRGCAAAPFAELLCEVLPTDPLARIGLLKRLASHLAGRLTSGAPSPGSAFEVRLRARAQHLLYRHLGPTLIAGVWNTAAGRGGRSQTRV